MIDEMSTPSKITWRSFFAVLFHTPVCFTLHADWLVLHPVLWRRPKGGLRLEESGRKGLVGVVEVGAMILLVGVVEVGAMILHDGGVCTLNKKFDSCGTRSCNTCVIQIFL